MCFSLTGCVVRIQSWWRMLKPYHAFRALKRAQRELKALYYRALRLYWKSERLYRVRDVNSYNLYLFHPFYVSLFPT